MPSNYTPPGFSGDDYEDDDAPVLAIAQPDVIVSGWPECEMVEAKQIAEYADLGNLSAVDPPCKWRCRPGDYGDS